MTFILHYRFSLLIESALVGDITLLGIFAILYKDDRNTTAAQVLAYTVYGWLYFFSLFRLLVVLCIHKARQWNLGFLISGYYCAFLWTIIHIANRCGFSGWHGKQIPLVSLNNRPFLLHFDVFR